MHRDREGYNPDHMSTTPAQPDVSQSNATLARAITALRDGELVVFPTETVYGVGALASSDAGYNAMCHLRDVPAGATFTVHVASPSQILQWTGEPSGRMKRLIEKALPGPITLRVDIDPARAEDIFRTVGLPAAAKNRVIENGVVSLRCPDHPVAQRLLESADTPVIATIAAKGFAAGAVDAEQAAAALGGAAKVVLDGGRSRYGKPSTVVRVKGSGPRSVITVEREGIYDERFIMKLTRWTVLMICSGNTCRSPMAEGLARKMIASSLGLTEGDLDAAGVRVISAGVFASPGLPVSPEAVEVMSRKGVKIAGHRSRMLERENINEADLILCMTGSHRRAVLAMSPSAADKTLMLDATGDIEDPIGAGQGAYDRCAAAIENALSRRLKEYTP